MEPSETTAGRRHDRDSGRVAVPEVAELLHLQRPAAAVAAAAVVLLALVVTLVLPGLLPANVLTGLVVGVLAVLAAVAAAVVLDGRDPVLRGPRHLRRDGHAVLARMAGPDPVAHGAPVLAALERRLEGRSHLGVVVTGTGTDPSQLAVAIGRGAAANGHTALVIDLRAARAPGIADVGDGTVRLGEAAELADDRPYAWIGAGIDRTGAAQAAAGVARRPPRDLELLLVVAPDAPTHTPELLTACERTVLLVGADTQQRAMVTARMDALQRAGARVEAVVIGGLQLAPDDHGAIPAAEPDDAEPAPVAAEPTPAALAPEPVSAEPEPAAPELEGELGAGTDTEEPEPVDAELQPDPVAAEPEPPSFSPFAPTAAQATDPIASDPDARPDATPDAALDAPADDRPPSEPPLASTAAPSITTARAEDRHATSPSAATSPAFRTATPPGGDTDVDGMAPSDGLVTAVALHHLMAQQSDQER